ncbi:MAG TPA: zinc dependent phospholipase C family protein [Thermoleophilia bacterium]|nr:zinc dependent phospholipase C family protein [Thermoleophilia bacterium]
MPDMLAHWEVAERVRACLRPGPLARLLDSQPDAYKVGAQGPDFLFYSRVWSGDRSRRDLALMVHQHRMRDVFHSLFEQAADLPTEEREVALAFACGYAAHLCLDAEAHPWVMYWTGDITERADAAQRALAFRRHGLLESSIDVMLRQQRSADPAWIRRSRLLRMSRRQTAVVARVFERALADVHGVAFSAAEGRAAFRNMALVYSAMSDRRAPLTRLLTTLAPVVDRSGVMDRTQLYPDDPLPLVVDLAHTRRRWFRPSLPDEPRTETLEEIFDLAVAETVRCLEAVEGLLEGAGAGETADAIGDRDMLTGIRCDDPRPLVAFSPHLARLDG